MQHLLPGLLRDPLYFFENRRCSNRQMPPQLRRRGQAWARCQRRIGTNSSCGLPSRRARTGNQATGTRYIFSHPTARCSPCTSMFLGRRDRHSCSRPHCEGTCRTWFPQTGMGMRRNGIWTRPTCFHANSPFASTNIVRTPFPSKALRKSNHSLSSNDQNASKSCCS